MVFFSVMEITLKHSSLYYKVINLLNKAIHLLNDSTYLMKTLDRIVKRENLPIITFYLAFILTSVVSNCVEELRNM